MKRCPKCDQTKSLDQFFKNRSMKDGVSGYCKKCHTASTNKNLHGPERAKYLRMRKDSNLRRTYGLSVDDYEDMLKVQQGECWICHRTAGQAGVRQLNVDHDHRCCPGEKSCGKCVRALLCGPCNKALGLLGDDVERFKAAIDYISRANMHTINNWY